MPGCLIRYPLLFSAVLLAACSSGRTASSPPLFDGEATLELVKYQVDLGPRVPGSDAHRRQLDWMEAFLTPLASVVQRQPLEAYNPFAEETIQGANLVASFYPDKRQRIMLCAHWDTRPVADNENPPSSEPIDGAVDGAAGTAIMLQMARLLADHEPAYGVDIVLFDVEDLGIGGGDLTHFFQGSRHFSQIARKTGYEPWFAVLVDLVGYRNAVYRRESISMQYAPDVVERVWELAKNLGLERFAHTGTVSVIDDHWVLNREAGIPSINITMGIEDYPYWHTREDTIDKVTADSLAEVGRVLVALLYR